MTPKISVIIATYNSGKTLQGALNSVINQSFQEWECVIVDGVSKDDTLDIIKKYAKKDIRIKWKSESDKGIYDAMNKGVTQAVGEWIFVLGSDDELLPDGLKAFEEYMDEADLIYGNFIGIYPSGNTYNGISKPLSALPKCMPASHQAMLMKKNLIDECGGFDLSFRSRADNNLVTKAFVNGYQFKRIDAYISKVRLDGFSSTRWDTISQIHRILRDNHAVKYPYLWALYYGTRWYFAKKVLDKIRKR